MTARSLSVRALALSALGMGCAAGGVEARKAPERCVTACGLVSVTSQCERLKAAEGRALAAFSRYTSWKRSESCAALRGWRVVVHEPAWSDSCDRPYWWSPVHKTCVGGIAHLADMFVEIESELYESNSFTHELAHVIGYELEDAKGHCQWRERKIKAALREATGRSDSSEEETWCR